MLILSTVKFGKPIYIFQGISKKQQLVGVYLHGSKRVSSRQHGELVLLFVSSSLHSLFVLRQTRDHKRCQFWIPPCGNILNQCCSCSVWSLCCSSMFEELRLKCPTIFPRLANVACETTVSKAHCDGPLQRVSDTRHVLKYELSHCSSHGVWALSVPIVVTFWVTSQASATVSKSYATFSAKRLVVVFWTVKANEWRRHLTSVKCAVTVAPKKFCCSLMSSRPLSGQHFQFSLLNPFYPHFHHHKVAVFSLLLFFCIATHKMCQM